MRRHVSEERPPRVKQPVNAVFGKKHSVLPWAIMVAASCCGGDSLERLWSQSFKMACYSRITCSKTEVRQFIKEDRTEQSSVHAHLDSSDNWLWLPEVVLLNIDL